MSSSGECGCADARKWRDYWTAEAIAERLAAEVDLYRRISVERMHDACNDVRGYRRMRSAAEDAAEASRVSFAELEARRAEVPAWTPTPMFPNAYRKR